MKRSGKYRSKMMGVIHRTAASFHRTGVMNDAKMREFDARCLVPEFVPDDLKALREREGASRADLAYSLGVSPDTVAQWERGQRKPNGSALKLLSLVKANGLKYIG